jgi:protein-S-isoprenylcysteine O-methyltransferase Ste14
MIKNLNKIFNSKNIILGHGFYFNFRLYLFVMDKTLGFIAPGLVSLMIFILNILLPGRWVTGYINKPGSSEKMKYHLNGIIVFFTVVFIWFISGYYKIIPFDWLYTYRWYGLAGAFTFGIIFSVAVVLPYPHVKKSLFSDLFLGRKENLQLQGGRADAKMWLYLTGATMLELNALSFGAHHYLIYGEQASTGIFLSTALLTWFIVDYFTFEEVHLYTYDLFAERVGFKLGWGCIVFYPYFYVIFLWSTADLPDPHTPAWLLVIYVLIFITGWILSRGANMQKYFFKKYPGRPFLWIEPKIISDGKNTLLVNGFWGISRHINYLGEILMATAIILCTGYPALLWPWLYPLYYVVLLFSRQIDDNKRCAHKYGDLWKVYLKKVPYRIIPFIY